MKVVSGDIFTPPGFRERIVIGHQVNCDGIMGGGLALQVRRRYPLAYKEYRKLCESRPAEKLLGTAQLVRFSGEPVSIANLFGQRHPGPGTDYDALRSALRALRGMADTIRLPYGIGCGIGGGDWGIVQIIIEEELGNAELWRLRS